MAATTAAVPETPQSIGAIGRIIGAITNPRATFEDIARKPGWIAPVIVFIILNLAITGIFGQRIGWRSIIEKQIAQNASAQRRMQQLPPDQREKIISQQVKIAPVFGYAFSVIGAPIVLVIIAAIFMGIFNATSSASLDFKTSLGIAAHAYLPLAIVGLLGILVLFLRPPDAVDIQNLVASNPGALLSNSAPRWLQVLLTSLDLFTFWVLALMAFGYSVARPRKLKMGTALAWVIAVWVVYVALKVGLAAIFS